MIYEEYTHMICECGGIIGMYDEANFSCNKCGKIKRIGERGESWDELMTNMKTGWIFPMVRRITHDI